MKQIMLDQKLFIVLVLTTALILVLDSLMWTLDGVPGVWAGAVLTGVTVLYYILNPAICLLWYYYIVYYIFRDLKVLKKSIVPMMIPTVVIAVLAVWSIFGNVLFNIDENNGYHRGPYFLLMAAVSAYYLIHTAVLASLKQRMIRRQEFIPILVFMIPPIVGAAFQTVFFGLSLVWPMTTLSLLFIYISMQNNLVVTDHLTGLYNRRQLDQYLRNRLQTSDAKIFGGIMIDINLFKEINDEHGHAAGDQALVIVSDILKQTFREHDFIARYGGDEFLIVIAVRQEEDLQIAVDRLNANVSEFNESGAVPYEIGLSIGYDLFSSKFNNVDSFVRHLDQLMYQSKQTYYGNDTMVEES